MLCAWIAREEPKPSDWFVSQSGVMGVEFEEGTCHGVGGDGSTPNAAILNRWRLMTEPGMILEFGPAANKVYAVWSGSSRIGWLVSDTPIRQLKESEPDPSEDRDPEDD